MGKSDDLQRLRAEQHARLERDAKRREDDAKRAPAPPPAEIAAPRPEAAVSAPIALVPVSLDVAGVAPVNEQRAVEKKAGNKPGARGGKKPVAAASKAKGKVDAGEETGRCPSCGKVKALNRGLVIDHQKGLGKACAGSRKRPV